MTTQHERPTEIPRQSMQPTPHGVSPHDDQPEKSQTKSGFLPGLLLFSLLAAALVLGLLFSETLGNSLHALGI